ncbi:hypothetical protein RND71_030731 [Anisodus tanguticus]|uniref:DUF4378 domain-containing protein n=1 Tax=Anisodus tanguticus TaxID=243964 RepID=A0AAE1RGY5_9SOLA|nr:hypothetical protein RND71_030731 [Anisodus tanguticus]
MEGKQHGQSVIAKLMGLDELPPKLPIPSNKKRRVLSENYLQKMASMGLREKNSILVGCSNTQKQQEVVKVFEAQMQHTYSHEKSSQSAAKAKIQKYTDFFVKESDKSDSEDFLSDRGDLPRYLQRAYGLSTKHDLQVSRPVNLAVFSGPNYVNVSKIASNSTRTTNGDTMRSLPNGPVDDDEADRECVVNSMEPLGNSFRVPRGIAQQTSHSVWGKVNHSSKPIPRALKVNESFLKLPSSSLFNNTREDGSLPSFANRSFMAIESKKQITERWKLTNACQEIVVGCRSHILEEMRAMAKLETRPQYMDMHISRSGSCSPLCINGKDGPKYECSRSSPLDSRVALGSPMNRIDNEASKYGWHLRKNEIVEGKDSIPCNLKQKAGLECRDLSSVLDQSSGSVSPCIGSAYGQPEKEITLERDSLYRGSKHDSVVPHFSNISPGNTVANANAGNHKSSSRITDELQSESHSYIEDVNTSTIPVGQESWKEAREIGALSTKHTMVDRKSPQKLRETNQASPNSVLEPPFKEEKLCASELNDRYADLCTVAMQLELLDTNSEESYSEGSEVAVSSDDVFERASLDLCQEDTKILIDFNTEESRDYSYLVDVLDEANLQGMNLTVDYNIWNSSECPVNSTVFDMLEKYRKQESWPKSDRKLLFDCINSGLSEILHSFMDIYMMEKSLKRRFHFTLGRNEVEEELWKLLVSPKKEVCKDLSEKALGNGTRWLKMEEEIGTICGEIESFLFEELAAELAYY